MKRTLLIPLLLVTSSVATSSVRAQQSPAPDVPSRSESKAAIDQAAQAYQQAEEKVTTLSSVGLSTQPPSNKGSLRDTLRPLVVESFIARQRLQQAEVNELRRRLIEIEQALADREKRMDEIVDARVDQLLSGRSGQAVTRIQTRIAGTVRRIGHRQPGSQLTIGDNVRAGDLLVEIMSGEIGQKANDLIDALEKLALDDKRFVSLTKSFREGTVPERSLRDAQHNVEDDKLAVERARRALTVWGLTEAEIDEIASQRNAGKSSWSALQIRAPIDGIIIEKNVNIGDVVKAGDTLFQVSSAMTGDAAVRTVARDDAGEVSGHSPEKFDLETRERLAQVDLQAAQEEYDAAEQQLQFAQAAFQAARVNHSAVADQQKNLRQAKAELERAKLRIEGLARQRGEVEARSPRSESALPGHSQPDAADQFDFETRARLAQVDFEEAKALCDAAQQDYDAHFEANKKAPGSTPETEMKILASKLRIAEARLQREKLKLEGYKKGRAEMAAAAVAAVVEAEAECQKAAAKLAGKTASRDSMRAQLEGAQAAVQTAVAKHDHEKKTYERFQRLLEQRAVEPQLVDERKDALDAAEAALSAAKSAVATAKANLEESAAAIDEARADVAIAQARLKAAHARRDRLLHNAASKDDPFANAPVGDQPKSQTPAVSGKTP